MTFPKHIFTGYFPKCHIQGIAVDVKKGFLYCSFTTSLLKYTLDGKLIGGVGGLTGHLGCIDFCEDDGRVWGSLEYKNDCIGIGIREKLGDSSEIINGFYAVAFDVDRITRPDMDATNDGVMTAVYLREVVNDYEAPGHRYGCSGIDGTGFGPAFGQPAGTKEYLHIAYGIYGDVARGDNDYQIILRYDRKELNKYERLLNQKAPHKLGPEQPDGKIFVFTGNTIFGVQNLEYDAHSQKWLMAVYRGQKPEFSNPPMFWFDGRKLPVEKAIKDSGERHPVIEPAGTSAFAYGQTGICALGGGLFYISHEGRDGENQFSDIYLYRMTDGENPGFERV